MNHDGLGDPVLVRIELVLGLRVPFTYANLQRTQVFQPARKLKNNLRTVVIRVVKRWRFHTLWPLTIADRNKRTKDFDEEKSQGRFF